MKNSVLIYLTIIVFSLLSCTNNEPIINTSKTTQSDATQTALNELQNHFNTNGTLRPNNNLTGNILFDYCFNFEYPITLSYNTGTSVTVNNFKGLVNIVSNMTNTLYINGILFPFNVTVFNQDTNAIIIKTISNENSFEELINTCNFDDVVGECNCSQEFNPVCIEMNTVNGEVFTMQFPNMCIAECEGFTIENTAICNDIVNLGIGSANCFNFVYPISLVTSNENTVVLNSHFDWEMAMYTTIGNFDFIYPFNVELENTNIESISNSQQFGELLNSCYETNPCGCNSDYNPVCVEVNGEIIEYNNICLAECEGYTQSDIINCNPSEDCSINNLVIEFEDCNYDGTFNLVIDFETNQPEDYIFIVNLDSSNNADFVFSVSELPITIYNVENSSQVTNFEVYFSNLCLDNGYFNNPICEDYGCWILTFPANITTEDTQHTVNNQNELNDLINTYSTSNLTIEYPFEVEFDGFHITVENESTYYKIGKWNNMCD